MKWKTVIIVIICIALYFWISHEEAQKQFNTPVPTVEDALEEFDDGDVIEYVRENYHIEDIWDVEEIINRAVGHGWVYDWCIENGIPIDDYY